LSDSQTRDLEVQLAGILSGDVEVKVTGAASLGAQRSTLFIDITDQGHGEASLRKAVVQIAASPLAVSDIDLEVRILCEARRFGVAVPEVLAWDVELGAVISARVSGESIPRRILRLVEANQGLGRKLAEDCGRALALLHRLPIREDAKLADYQDPRRYVEELNATIDCLSTPHPTFRLGLNWLARNADAIERDPVGSLVHGDFRNGNLLISEKGLTAVLDWEIVHLGDAMEDLAWLCLRTWRFGNDDREVGGFASLDDLKKAYESAGGEWRESGFRWWTVARTIWWGLGLARQTQAYLEGHSKSIVLAASGRRVVELEYDVLQLIAAQSVGAASNSNAKDLG